jgi:hypothetical protein
MGIAPRRRQHVMEPDTVVCRFMLNPLVGIHAIAIARYLRVDVDDRVVDHVRLLNEFLLVGCGALL